MLTKRFETNIKLVNFLQTSDQPTRAQSEKTI